ncbi:MAG: hypothetical protein Q8L11_03135 [Candidatus Moranbacteria bacterium]|nr:hypothetical protein [Candidatus Moranbacteria bacterium]
MEKIWPKVIQDNAVGYGVVALHGEGIPYAILSRNVNKDLPGFVGCLKDGGERSFFISEDVPAQFREPQVLHEIMEFEELAECPGSCLMALRYELTLVPADLYEEYLRFRRDFFRRLMAYCIAHSEWYAQQRISDFQESLDHLETIAP